MAWAKAIGALRDRIQGPLASTAYSALVPVIVDWTMRDLARVCKMQTQASLTDADIIRCLEGNPAFNRTSFERDDALNGQLLGSPVCLFPVTAQYWAAVVLIVAILVPLLDVYMFVKTHRGRSMMVCTFQSEVMVLYSSSCCSHQNAFLAWMFLVFAGNLLLTVVSCLFWLDRTIGGVFQDKVRLFDVGDGVALTVLMIVTGVLIVGRVLLGVVVSMVEVPRFTNPDTGLLETKDETVPEWLRHRLATQLGLSIWGLRLLQEGSASYRDIAAQAAARESRNLYSFKDALSSDRVSREAREQLLRFPEGHTLIHTFKFQDLESMVRSSVYVHIEGLTVPKEIRHGEVMFEIPQLPSQHVTFVFRSDRFLHASAEWKYPSVDVVDLLTGRGLHFLQLLSPVKVFVEGWPAGVAVSLPGREPFTVRNAELLGIRHVSDSSVNLMVEPVRGDFPWRLQRPLMISDGSSRVALKFNECSVPGIPFPLISGEVDFFFGKEIKLSVNIARDAVDTVAWPLDAVLTRVEAVFSVKDRKRVAWWPQNDEVLLDYDCATEPQPLQEQHEIPFTPLNFAIVQFCPTYDTASISLSINGSKSQVKLNGAEPSDPQLKGTAPEVQGDPGDTKLGAEVAHGGMRAAAADGGAVVTEADGAMKRRGTRVPAPTPLLGDSRKVFFAPARVPFHLEYMKKRYEIIREAGDVDNIGMTVLLHKDGDVSSTEGVKVIPTP
jgi:hypothetical protein